MQKPPEGIPEYGKSEPTKGFDQESKTPKYDKPSFESHLEEGPAKGEEISGKTPMELAQKSNLLASPTQESITSQISQSQNTIKTMQNDLNFLKENNLSLKAPHERLVQRKFQTAFENIQTANSKLGLKEESFKPDIKNPVNRFLAYLSYGQAQLLGAKQKLEEIQKSKKQIQPTQMMLIQVKLAQAQQSLEFSSVLISQIVTGLKQMMNIQI